MHFSLLKLILWCHLGSQIPKTYFRVHELVLEWHLGLELKKLFEALKLVKLYQLGTNEI
jgi:hypothetical protein